ISVTGSGSSALFQLFNPWGLGNHQPQAITWAQLTQAGAFIQDGDTIVGAAAATGLPSGEPATSGPGLHRADAFAPQLAASPPELGGDDAGLTSDGPLAADKPDDAPHSELAASLAASLDSLFRASGPGLYLADVFSPIVGGAPSFAPQFQAPLS